MSGSPFIVILGSWLIHLTKAPAPTIAFAAWLGAITVIIQYAFAIALLVQAHKEMNTYKDL